MQRILNAVIDFIYDNINIISISNIISYGSYVSNHYEYTGMHGQKSTISYVKKAYGQLDIILIILFSLKPLERYTSCSNNRLTIFSCPPRVAIVSALTPSKLQIDGSAPFWSSSLTHSKCPSRQACINGDHPYRFKASRYSGYCKISSLAL